MDKTEVLFSDESHFKVSMSDGRDRVWRRNGERFAGCCVNRDRWGGGSVLVWGGITAYNHTQLHVLDTDLQGPNLSSHCPAIYATSFAKWRIPTR